MDSYEKALRNNPYNADAHYNLGLLYEKTKSDPDKAIEHYQEYLKLSPDANDRDEVLGWIQRLQ